MKKKDLAFWVCRILSLTVFVKFISSSHGIVYVLTQDEFVLKSIDFIQMATLPTVLLIISIVLWSFANKISSFLINNPKYNDDKVLNLDYELIKPLTFFVLGLVLIIQAISALSNGMINIISDSISNSSRPSFKVSSFNFAFLLKDC